MRIAPHHALSISRIILGLFVVSRLRAAPVSATVLPAVLLACVADYCDGIVARRARAESTSGRLLDNVCDATFLALAFFALANARVWTAAAGDPAQRWPLADWLPLIALGLSFGTYLLRWRAAHARGGVPRPSPRGHHAGIANYVLALLGGVEAYPGIDLGSWVRFSAVGLVVALNIAGAADNCRLLALRDGDVLRET